MNTGAEAATVLGEQHDSTYTKASLQAAFPQVYVTLESNVTL